LAALRPIWIFIKDYQQVGLAAGEKPMKIQDTMLRLHQQLPDAITYNGEAHITIIILMKN
jgi:hypothetical protein